MSDVHSAADSDHDPYADERSHRRKAGLGLLLLILALFAIPRLTDSVGRIDSESLVSSTPEPTKLKVVYEVEGTADHGPDVYGSTASLTAATPTGIQQRSVRVAPHPHLRDDSVTRLSYAFDRGAPLSFSAQMDEDGTSITCRIIVRDEVISENTSTTPFGIASCRGSVP